MPTLGPSLLFAAGLVLGVGTGALIPRPTKEGKQVQPPVQLPPAPPSGERREVGPIRTPAGGVVLQGGFPGPTPDIITRKAYTAAYDRRLRHPAWTAEHLTAASLSRTPPPSAPGVTPVPLESARKADTDPLPPVARGDRSRSVFMEDEGIPEMFRAKLQDYFRSGYDRGHMVPAADAKISQQAMDETFYLTNIAPQVGDGFNRHYWAYLEDFCRRLTSNFEDVYVFTVPLYMPKRDADGKYRVTYEVIGTPPSVSVPTHFAKVVLATRPDFSYPQSPSPQDKAITSRQTVKELAMGAFVLPNKEIPDETDLRTFISPGKLELGLGVWLGLGSMGQVKTSSTGLMDVVEVVERVAGLQLFNEDLKGKSRQLCAVTQCQVIVRRFDDARKEIPAQARKNSRQK
ncbi:Nuclease [Saitozyma sp. JCM 24511]|nr:Nuclease [Saitozyma sp. JCM 24511]